MKCNVQCALQLCESTARIPFIYQMSWTSTLASLRYGSSLCCCCCCCLYFIFSSISIPSIAQPSFFLFLIIISHEMVWSLIVFVCELFSFLCCFLCVCVPISAWMSNIIHHWLYTNNGMDGEINESAKLANTKEKKIGETVKCTVHGMYKHRKKIPKHKRAKDQKKAKQTQN